MKQFIWRTLRLQLRPNVLTCVTTHSMTCVSLSLSLFSGPEIRFLISTSKRTLLSYLPLQRVKPESGEEREKRKKMCKRSKEGCLNVKLDLMLKGNERKREFEKLQAKVPVVAMVLKVLTSNLSCSSFQLQYTLSLQWRGSKIFSLSLSLSLFLSFSLSLSLSLSTKNSWRISQGKENEETQVMREWTDVRASLTLLLPSASSSPSSPNCSCCIFEFWLRQNQIMRMEEGKRRKREARERKKREKEEKRISQAVTCRLRLPLDASLSPHQGNAVCGTRRGLERERERERERSRTKQKNSRTIAKRITGGFTSSGDLLVDVMAWTNKKTRIEEDTRIVNWNKRMKHHPGNKGSQSCYLS